MGMLFAFELVRRIIVWRRSQEGTATADALGGTQFAEELDDAEMHEREGTATRSRLLAALALLVGVSLAGWIIGLLLARRMTSGDESTDEFRLASIMGGKEFRSHAAHLKSGTAITCLGGMALDLRDASLDPTGASLELTTTMGGIEVRVPQHWVVEVDQETLGDALEVDVPAPDELPDDAPKLRIHAVTRMGGGLITARKD